MLGKSKMKVFIIIPDPPEGWAKRVSDAKPAMKFIEKLRPLLQGSIGTGALLQSATEKKVLETKIDVVVVSILI